MHKPRSSRGQKIIARAPEEALRLAECLGARAPAGLVICLSGPLGAGKTTFVRGFLRGRGYRGAVRSPTFALVHEYRSLRPRVYHLDLFRVKEKELTQLGLEEYLSDPRAVCLIEWPEVAKSLLPSDRLEISFSHFRSGRSQKISGRKLVFKATGIKSRAMIML